MYTTHYPLTEDERTSFDLVMGNNQVAWEDLSAPRQDAIHELIRKYPDLSKTAVWIGSDSAASTGVPLSQMSQLPDTLSQVSTSKAWDAYNKTKSSWENFSKSRQQQRHQQQGHPESQTPSPDLQRRTVPPSPSMRPRPTSFPPELPISDPPPVTRGAQNLSTVAPPDMTGLHISPADRRPIESTPPPVWRRRHPPSVQSASPGYPAPGPSWAMTQKRDWLLQQHEASRQRFTAALHAAVDAEGDMVKYKSQLRQLGGGFQDDDEEYEEEDEEELEGQLFGTAQKPVAPKSNAKKRRERKKKLNEGRVAKEN